MGSRICTFAATVALAGTVSTASAQTATRPEAMSMTALQTAVACAPPPILATEPTAAPRVVGSQDVVDRELFGMPDLLVVDAGSARDIQVNNLYFIRRLLRGAETQHDHQPHAIHTAGWVRVIAVNETTALVAPVHVCSDFRSGDFLDQFSVPAVPDSTDNAPLVQTDLNFAAYSRVLSGSYDRRSAGIDDFVIIEHGADRNLRVGARFGIYRDLQLSGNPLKPIGEAIAVNVGQSLTVVRITRARDAVFDSDVMVPRMTDVGAGAGATR